MNYLIGIILGFIAGYTIIFTYHHVVNEEACFEAGYRITHTTYNFRGFCSPIDESSVIQLGE